MSKLRVNAFSISLDGFGAGPGQALETPMGVGGMALHEWVLGTSTFQRLVAGSATLVGPDDRLHISLRMTDHGARARTFPLYSHAAFALEPTPWSGAPR